MNIRVGSPNGRAAAAMREKRLYEATLCGSVESLHELMCEDKLTLARVSLTCFNETHLHIAAMLGHADFVKALLSYSSDLVTKLDDHGRTPMHLASGAGRVEVIRLLVVADANVCLARDEDGRTPLHLAVMHGHLDVVRELIRARPQVVSTRYMLVGGETILHTCVVHNRLEVLKVLMSMGIDDDFLNFKDDNGYTILHTSTALKHKEIIRYLATGGSIVRVNARNENGFTALDMMYQMPRDMKTMEIVDLLVKAGGGRRDREINPHRRDQETQTTEPPKKNKWKNKKHGKFMWVEKKRDAIMVVATVLAGMAYQAVLNPPGGVWQEAKDLAMFDAMDNGKVKNVKVMPGTSVMGIYYPGLYLVFWALNTISFGTAIGIIFLLVSGIPFRRGFCMWILMIFMWLTITSMALTYTVSLMATLPETNDPTYCPDYVDPEKGSWHFYSTVIGDYTEMGYFMVNGIPYSSVIGYSTLIGYSLIGWIGLFSVIMLVHFGRFIWWIITKVRQCWQPKMRNMSFKYSHDDRINV